MKKYVKVILVAGLLSTSHGLINAQQKKVKKASSRIASANPAVKFTPKEFGSISSVSDITDVKETSSEYESVKNLVETNGVTLVYADSTFRPKDPLRRGDFIVSLNSALEAIKRTSEAGGLDSSSIITYDKNQSNVTNVSEIKDVKESSIYYPAVQSLVEHWGIDAPFSKSKLLNAGSPMPEGDVYDILKVTLGYSSSALNPYATAMTRAKFAMVLNNAVNLKLSEVNAMVSARKDSLEDLRIQQAAMFKQQDKQRKDSVARAVELSRLDAQKKEAEAWTKLSDSQKRKQLKNQNSK